MFSCSLSFIKQQRSAPRWKQTLLTLQNLLLIVHYWCNEYWNDFSNDLRTYLEMQNGSFLSNVRFVNCSESHFYPREEKPHFKGSILLEKKFFESRWLWLLNVLYCWSIDGQVLASFIDGVRDGCIVSSIYRLVVGEETNQSNHPAHHWCYTTPIFTRTGYTIKPLMAGC